MTRKFSYESHHIGDGVLCGAVVVGVETRRVQYSVCMQLECRIRRLLGAPLSARGVDDINLNHLHGGLLRYIAFEFLFPPKWTH
jgi:hypothetical protein